MSKETKEKVVPVTTIELYPEEVKVITVNENGIKAVKNTNIENISAIFMKEQAMETPLLPSQWGVVKYYRKNNYEGYVLTTPATERKITIKGNFNRDNSIDVTVPVPPLLWIFEVNTSPCGTKRLTHSMMYALKHELLSLKDTVLHAPYPNIGISHGICWGRENPEVPSSKSIQNIPARFFSQPFNFDLSSNRVQRMDYRNEELNIRESGTDCAIYHMLDMADRLAAAKEAGETFSYPFDTLKTVGTSKVEDVIRSYLPMIFR